VDAERLLDREVGEIVRHRRRCLRPRVPDVGPDRAVGRDDLVVAATPLGEGDEHAPERCTSGEE